MEHKASIQPVEGGEVKLRNVTKQFGEDVAQTTVIQDCTFEVERGKFTVVIGPSGCGKTTLINVIAGYETPTSGEVVLDGATVSGPGPDRLVVFQETALFPWMTTLNNVMYGPVVQRDSQAADIEKKAHELIELVGLSEFSHKYPIQLSGGMQRRAELARALINNPRVLLMDEPFRGLDAMTRQLMQEYLLRLFEGSGRTILFVTSEIDEAILLADKLLVLSRAPTHVKATITVDLPRPRNLEMLTSRRYAELKSEALSILYQEAVSAFAAGSNAAADLVEAFEQRQSVQGKTDK
ncbi:MAG: ABC transporter ATP-binding protein [Gammaproteobacteria bacterium]|nr:ABC transporter ATP-binding protein [Gammaproteobacteria bacterium]